MSTLESLIAHPAARSLGWTLLHFVWQGTLIALLLASFLPFLRRRSSNARYAAASLALVAMLAAPVADFLLARAAVEGSTLAAWFPPAGTTAGAGAPALDAGVQVPTTASSWRAWLVSGLSSSLPWVVVAWSLGVAALSLRLIGGWWTVQRLKRRGVTAIASRWQATVDELALRLGVGRPVELLESVRVGVPTVVGWFRPVILVPASALTGLSPRQLEAILAHELAHIRRHDYLVNLLQSAIETLLFYHPAVWWVSRQVRLERENCCDDLAVAITGDAVGYARALAGLEEVRGRRAGLAVAAGDGSLLRRIQRLVAPRPRQDGTPAAPLALMCIALMVVGMSGVQVTRGDATLAADTGHRGTSMGGSDDTGPPLALSGYDPTKLVEGRRVKGSPEHSAVYRGRRYLFTHESCKRAFEADPERYAPVNAELCVVSGERTDPRHFAVYAGKIFLFCCPDGREEFLEDPESYLEGEPDASRGGPPDAL